MMKGRIHESVHNSVSKFFQHALIKLNSRDDFIVKKDGRRYKVVQVMYVPKPFAPGAPPTRLENFIDSGLTRMQAEKRIYEYIIEQMKLGYEKRIMMLQQEIQELSSK